MNFNFSTHQDIKTAYKESPQKFSDKEIAEFPQNKVPPPRRKYRGIFFSLPSYLKTNKRKEKVKKRRRKDVFIYLFKFLL